MTDSDPESDEDEVGCFRHQASHIFWSSTHSFSTTPYLYMSYISCTHPFGC